MVNLQQVLEELKIMYKNLNIIENYNDFDKEKNIQEEYIINSIKYIQIFVELEKKYDFEFEDSDLIFNKLNTSLDIAKTVVLRANKSHL